MDTGQSEPPVAGGNHITILVIDDDPLVLSTIGKMLTLAGYGVIVAQSASQALNIARTTEENVDLALLDLTIPGLPAERVVAGLKESSPQMRVLLTSGYPLGDAAPQVLSAGADGFIQKPFALDKLAGKIDELLGGEPG
ncbi:MAG: response regulator [Phycisphaerales bacterium]|nr:MAG: response regulator [Phycisphaerales bacterium]